MAHKKTFIKTITKTQARWRVAGIAILAIVCLFLVLPNYVNVGLNWVNNQVNLGLPLLPESSFNLGLDLQGGAHLVYKADVIKVAPDQRAASVEGVRDVIERRVRGGLGVAEPLVQTTKFGEEHRVIVELPGVTNVSDAIQMIGETPVLEFKEENNDPPRELTVTEKKDLDEFNRLADKKIREAKNALYRMNFEEAVGQYSEDEASKKESGKIGFITETGYPEMYSWAKTAAIGDVSGVIKTADGYSIVKKLSERTGEKSIQASHLLICYRGAERCDATYTKSSAKEKIEELQKQINKDNFVELTKQYSTEPGAQEGGGDLGLFKKGEMVPAFENAVWDLPMNTVSEVIETEFGYHLAIKIGEEQKMEYELAKIFVPTKSVTDIIPPVGEWKITGLDGSLLKRAEVVQNSQIGEIQVSLTFNDEGAKLFGDITRRNIDKPVAIFLDGEAISIPKVNEPILDGSAVITGGFTWDEAKLLAQRLNSGALPVPVELISQQKIDAALGVDSLTTSFKAGLIGLLLVIIFMVFYYRLPGLISVLALLIYAAITLAIFKVIGVTLTLSGIAGFILSVGMAVDANVLVFERLKEELKQGKSLKPAMEEAFVRAWTSIRDSNVTTLISCAFLIWMDIGFVQGFAVTLAIGILVSMFTAIIVTRNLMRVFFSCFKDKANWLFLGSSSNKEQ
ncbi:MAG: protein translocase subunit SecD [Candidatus Magasanikbacteria bacterium CG10_big_fil_rev_8_21_14_0_10_36_32]|uniref:Protein translocase subunit SecD n=1 Tax=Candidatus Magasanikbacteria bacterium CG10_big_fil_rev_8_21_14_0_10_36_32 TaxID=1974646 RepID=A0A2M6W5I5_9BACT|nr:MAG: protein translocase subunit SecD [Candidatus Magasanikbacteria bacterium CG10_big_fil_rev_8_21_14_0_10_36_32]